MARVERRHMGCVRAWRVCELHGLCEGTARVERRRTWARENGAWSGLVERAAWRGRGLPGLQEQRSRLRARAARGAGRVEGWSGLSGHPRMTTLKNNLGNYIRLTYNQNKYRVWNKCPAFDGIPPPLGVLRSGPVCPYDQTEWYTVPSYIQGGEEKPGLSPAPHIGDFLH